MVTWKKVKWHNIQFTVSDTGRVMYKGRPAKKYELGGYWYTNVHGRQLVPFHHLIAKAFKSNYTYKCIPNHLDCNKKNNKASNLRCGTRSDNTKHAYKMGVIQNGREHWKDVTRRSFPNKFTDF